MAADADVDRKARRELLRFVFCGDGGADRPPTDDGPRTKKMHIKRKLIGDGISAIILQAQREIMNNEIPKVVIANYEEARFLCVMDTLVS